MTNKAEKRRRAFNFPDPNPSPLPFKPDGKLDVITSCSMQGYLKYGEKSLNSFIQFWPKEVKLHVVSEDDLKPVLPTEYRDRILFHSLNDYHIGMEFLTRHKDNKAAHGFKRAGMYNFREDAYRFSKKVFAIRLVTQQAIEGRFIWLDADTYTIAPVPGELLYRMPPEDFNLAHLYRGARYHSECGFVGYNLNCHGTTEFIAKFAALYETDKVFELKEWHDSWVFDWLTGHSRVRTYHIPHTNVSHPFVYSELGKYIDHLKGRRKDIGKSPELAKRRG